MYSLFRVISRSGVADALRVRILPGETRQIEKKPTTSSEAYALYLKGRYFWNKRTKETLLKAIECFKQAITTDSNFALVYSGIADSYSVLVDQQHLPDAIAGRPKAGAIFARAAGKRFIITVRKN